MQRFLRGNFQQQVGITFLAQILGLILLILYSAIIARQLGPEGKGILALALLIPEMLGTLLNCGIGVANVYLASSRQVDIRDLTANSVGFTILVTALGVSLVGILALTGWLQKLAEGVPTWLIWLAMLRLPIWLLGVYFNTLLQGLHRIATVNVLTIVQNVLLLVGTFVALSVLRLGLLGALLASLGSMVVIVLAAGLLLRRMGGVFRPRWTVPVIRSTLSYGLRGHIANVLQFFNYRLDMFLVNFYLGPAGVGIYTVSVRLAELLWHLPNAVGFVIFPKAAATKPQEMNSFTPRVFRITLALTVLGALGLASVGKFLIQLIYSPTFLGAYTPMLALLPGVVFLGGAKVLTNEIAGRGYPHYNSLNSGIGLILTVALDLTLIPKQGVLGAALASSIAYTAVFVTAIISYLVVSQRQALMYHPSDR